LDLIYVSIQYRRPVTIVDPSGGDDRSTGESTSERATHALDAPRPAGRRSGTTWGLCPTPPTDPIMAHVTVRGEERDLDEPFVVEGLPGVGLVGKIATDHLVAEFDMDHYADVHCDGLPRIGVYEGGGREVVPPVRLYVDESRDLLALRSDVPVSPDSAREFAGCITGWLGSHDATPIYLSGMPAEKDDAPPSMFGVATGDGASHLEGVGIEAPGENGVVSGPTGALVNEAVEAALGGVCLVVESDPRFPDPEAARVLIDGGIGPITGVDVDLADLVDRTEEIRQTKERLAKRMQQADEESSKAQPLRMYQ
jgi:uncharacterized protein